MNKVNMHIHSIASDGILTGVDIVENAIKLNLHVIAITDHDSIDESRRIYNLRKNYNIDIIKGVELSADYQNGICHILGYDIDYDIIERFSESIKESRINKAKKIVEMLNEAGYKLDYNDVLNASSNNIPGRRDIAKILVINGYFSTEEEVLNTILIKGKEFYIETEKKSIDECVEIIKKSGGISVLAHPWTLNLNKYELEEFILVHKIQGIEVYNNTITEHLFKELDELSDKLSLYKTCGTDFHGYKNYSDLVVRADVDCSRILRKLGGN